MELFLRIEISVYLQYGALALSAFHIRLLALLMNDDILHGGLFEA